MDTLRKIMFTGWNFMRWLRLSLGRFVAYQAFESQNGLLGLLAGMFIFHALANAACCGSSSCNTAPPKQSFGKTKDVENEVF